MVVETILTTIIGPTLARWTTTTIANNILNYTKSQLNKEDIDKALKLSINAAEEATKKQLLFKYDDKQIRSFLNDYFQGQVLEQLKNPLLEKSIDLEFLEFTFKQTIKNNPDKYNKIQQDYIKPWLEVFKTEYLKEIGTYINYQYAKVKYFKQLANRYDDVKFSGIEVEGQEIDKSEQLLKIFVMQDVKEEKKERYSRLRETAFLTSDNNQISRQQELFRQQREASDLANYGENSFSAQQLLTKNKSKKVVLLGAPGSGKTTLMSYFSVAITENKANLLGLDPNIDWLPIFIRMRDYILHDNLGILDYYCSEFCDKDLSVKQLPDGFFEHWLETGRALILLDGLDEIVDEGKRNEIVKNIDNFISSYDQNSVIITSRPAGYRRDFFDAETFPHYWLQPFDNEQISEFIEKWYNSRTADETEAKARKDDIRKALDNNPRIKLLARNPLLLTIIALIHRYQAQLPKQRHELYERAVKTLLTTWDTNKLLKKHTKLKYLENDDWYDIMRNLAHWIHSYQKGIEGNELEGTLIDKKELIKFLTNYIETKKKIDFDYAEQEAERFLNFIRDRSGLLNEQGTDCYGFVHKTFQEYLCAQKNRQDMKRKRYDFQIILDAITNHLHDAHWREVLLLLIAQEEEESAAEAIKVILNNNSDYEQWLHRDLLFAGSCLAENPKGLKNVEKDEEEEKDLATDILERLVSLEISEPKISGLRKELFKVFCSLYETDFEDQCLALLKAESHKIGKSRLLTYRAELGEQETVIDELIKQLSDQNLSDDVRRSAAYALGELRKDSEEVISALLTALCDQSLFIRLVTTQALENLGKTSDQVLPLVVGWIKDNENSEFVENGIEVLWRLVV
ncbi:MAG: NACHT domain-containing NTPase [Crocosphaera sp.]